LELHKLPKKSDDTELWNWMRFMNAKDEEEMAVLAKRNLKIGKVTAVILEMSEDEVERRHAEAREKELRDRRAEVLFGKEQGIKIGERRGRKEGREEGKADGIEQATKAIRALAEGKTAEEAARISGLPAESVKKLMS
jgi:flagellar biosynthesis/type III secretory pathway protein FliH